MTEASALASPDLEQRHVVVVGGGSGIGKAVAMQAAGGGARMTIASRSIEKLNASAADIGDGVRVAPVDMTDEPAVAAWATALDPMDHLVVSASSAVHGAFDEVPVAEVRAMFDAKFFGPYTVARSVLPRLASGGSITLFSGVLSRRPSTGTSGLSAVNSAVEGLARALALELGGRARVNCVSPGMVRSEAYAAMEADARDAMYRATGARLPVGRVGETAEIARAVLMTMSNGYVTGAVLDVDGGHTIGI